GGPASSWSCTTRGPLRPEPGGRASGAAARRRGARGRFRADGGSSSDLRGGRRAFDAEERGRILAAGARAAAPRGATTRGASGGGRGAGPGAREGDAVGRPSGRDFLGVRQVPRRPRRVPRLRFE